jgi:ATP-dependent Clp protease ATP-binding subunit ClpA
MNRHSQSLLLVWKIAEIEARQLNATTIETSHLLIALAKAVDVDLAGLLSADTRQRDNILEECLREIRRLRQVFEKAHTDVKKLRRQLRTKCKKAAPVRVPEEFLHRSDAARAVFADAEAFADFSTVDAYPIHLAYSVLIAPSNEIDEVMRDLAIDQSRIRQVAKDEMLRGGRKIGSAINPN